MKKAIIFLCGFISAQASQVLAGPEYMERFNTYMTLSDNLPITTPTPTFIEFIQGTAPLSNKLRERWLYELARTKNWVSYNQYYQPSNDFNLVCYEQIAKYNLGFQQEALKNSIPLWLSGESRPTACNNLFELLIKDPHFNQDLMTQRIALALEQRNIQLARYLLKQYKEPHPIAIQTLNEVIQNPNAISKLNPGHLNSIFYLYGLKRMIAINMDKALQLWQQSKTEKILNEAQKQAFLAHLALYKAMRNSEDTKKWFAKVMPQYYNDTLVDWQIRFALKHNDWNEVSTLINHFQDKDIPCWQYWLGRALEKQGNTTEARTIYESLAKNRHYYGFLASLRLQQTPNFANEPPIKNLDLLKPYQDFLTQIKTLYTSKNVTQASRLLNAFISELPKDEASALVYWIDTTLQWHGKSVYLSNTDHLNNQLILRFPLAYKETVQQYSKKYAIAPEFIYAIIRQESGFREDVTSIVGARGLMQVMPHTAGMVSKTHKIPYQNKDQLFLSEKNIHIGVAYLKQLATQFNNHPILIAAAYNAGPKQVTLWLKTHPPKEIDVWIETLLWKETRNYLKNVMAFYVVYQYRLHQKPNIAHFLESFVSKK